MKLKKIHFMSRPDAEGITPCSTDAIISISCPFDPANLNIKWAPSQILRLEFNDIDEDELMTHLGLKLFSPVDAKQIIDFAEHQKNKIETLFVHCDAGISRSGAVAKFLSEKYNLPFPTSYMLYNKFIYRVLTNTLNNMMWKENYEP